jgi:ABC-type transport system involved in cytochrome c biogenesis permease component
MRSHFLHMILYSTLVAVFFGVLVRDTPSERRRLGGLLWLAMVVGGLGLAYVMYPFPG